MSAAWVKANPEKSRAHWAKYGATEAAKAKRAEWYQANKERILDRLVEYRAETTDLRKATAIAWRAANPGVLRNQKHARRARELKVGGKLSRDISEKLFKLQKGKCPCCGKLLGKNYHLDHKMPLALGGPNIDDNMQLLRQRCNAQKGARNPIEFMQSRGLLL
jgi:5-methylcytosine-specific restriction endonuclease McrA